MPNKFLLLCAALLALALPALPVRAQETQPGDPCTVAERFHTAAGPENPGTGYFLVCDGSAWQAVMEWDTATGRSLFQVNDDAGTCSADKTGRLRYDEADDEWCYCDGAAWKTFPSGGCACTLQDGLVGHWKFEDGTGSATAADSSGNGNTGTLTSMDPNTDWVAGKLGGALDFDGTNDYVVVADNSALDMGATQDFTLSGWFNRDTSATEDVIISKWQGSNLGYTLGLGATVDGAQLFFEVEDGTDAYGVESSSTFTSSGWKHFVLRWDDDTASNIDLFINGVEESVSRTGTLGNIGSLANTSGLAIGIWSNTLTAPFDGKLDDLRIYNRALSTDEIASLYNGGAGCQ